MSRVRRPPSHNKIVAANADLLARLDIAPSEALDCWACRDRGCDIERAHVIPVREPFCGDDDPGNFFLLCTLCHFEQPDSQPRERQELWLKLRMSAIVRRMLKVAVALRTAPYADVAHCFGLPHSDDENAAQQTLRSLNMWLGIEGISVAP